MNLAMKTHAFLFFAAIATASAQYTIAWQTMDGGSGSGTTGVFAMSGTIGQPDAFSGNAGTFSLLGGYWSDPNEPLPLLRIFLKAQNITLAWPNPSTDFELQTSPSLSPPSWTTVAAPPVLVGGEKQVTWGAANGTRFFRLERPY